MAMVCIDMTKVFGFEVFSDEEVIEAIDEIESLTKDVEKLQGIEDLEEQEQKIDRAQADLDVAFIVIRRCLGALRDSPSVSRSAKVRLDRAAALYNGIDIDLKLLDKENSKARKRRNRQVQEAKEDSSKQWQQRFIAAVKERHPEVYKKVQFDLELKSF